MFGGGSKRELLGMVHFDDVEIGFVLNLGWRRRFGLGICLPFSARSKEETGAQQ